MAINCILTSQIPEVLDGVTENIQTQLDNKVDKDGSKVLSTNDYTTAEKTKLSGIETGAQKNTVTSVNGNTGAVTISVPTVNNVTIAIQKNGTQVGSFTTNQSSAKTINMTIAKSDVGLGNVDNTSDANKPISTATQTALDTKQANITGGASTIALNNLTTNRALVSDSSGKVAVSAVTSTELGYIDGVTSNVQTQLNAKQTKISVSGLLKGDGNGGVSAAVKGTDYAGVINKLTLTLATANWLGSASPYTQDVTITGGTAYSQVDVQFDATVIQQMLDDDTSGIFVVNNNGTFTAYAVGEKPTVDLSIQATVYEVMEVN